MGGYQVGEASVPDFGARKRENMYKPDVVDSNQKILFSVEMSEVFHRVSKQTAIKPLPVISCI